MDEPLRALARRIRRPPDPRSEAASPSGAAADDDERDRRRERLVLGALLAGGVLLVGFVWVRSRGMAAPASFSVRPSRASVVPGETVEPKAGTATRTAHVHVAGAVVRPGLYELPSGSRTATAIEAAGGAAPGADLARVNLAGRVSDGQQLLVPKVGQAAPVAPGGPVASGAAPSGPVNLNTADVTALDALPGVGPSTAQKIVAFRERHGPFRSVRQLLDVPGIGDGKFADLEPLVTV